MKTATTAVSQSTVANLVTLRDAVERYIAEAPDLRSARKLRHHVNCWEKHTNGTLPITTADIEKFRRSCIEATLSPTTIEGIISDLLTVLRGTKCEVPERGRRLKRPPPKAEQPSETDLGKVYAIVGQANWPKRTFAGTQTYGPDARRDGKFKKWSQAKRVRFWKGILFLGYWTGLRIGDLRSLEWSCVLPDRIEWVAAKTGIRHVFPVTPEVQRHLDIVRGLSRKYVLPIPQGSLRFVRKELKRLCKIAGVEAFGLQMIRRASITEWCCTVEDAGALIHGSGLGVRKHYVSPLKVLTRAAERFELPDSMCAVRRPLPSNGEPAANASGGSVDVAKLLAELSPNEFDMLMRLVKALSPKPAGESSSQLHCKSP